MRYNRAQDAFPRSCLEGFTDITVAQPGFRYYLDRIREVRPFTFVKRTHGFWDRYVDLCNSVPKFATMVKDASGEHGRKTPRLCLEDPEVRKFFEFDRETLNLLYSVGNRTYRHYWEWPFPFELLQDLNDPHRDEAYIEANAFRGYSNSDLKPARNPVNRLRSVYLAINRNDRQFHDALVWKDAIFDGQIKALFKVLRTIRVIVVGPPHLENLGQLLSLPDFQHIAIHSRAAIGDRECTLNSCKQALKHSSKNSPVVILFQAGVLAHWLTFRLHDPGANVFLIEMGRALDIWTPSIASGQPWFRNNRERIIQVMDLQQLYGDN